MRTNIAKKARDRDRGDQNAHLLRQAEEKARLVSEQLLTAEEEERRRIARAKHAETKRVIARLIATDRALVLSVTDCGRGFDPAAAERRPTGLGLKIMHERLRLVGGSLAIRSIPGRGTRLRAWVPFGEAS